MRRWSVFSDAAHGGETVAALSPSGEFPGSAEFRGELAPAGRAGAARSGFAGISRRLGGDEDDDQEDEKGYFVDKEGKERVDKDDDNDNNAASSSSSSSPFALSAAAAPPLDLSAFDALRFRIRNGDGRPWVVSLRTENWLVGDLAVGAGAGGGGGGGSGSGERGGGGGSRGGGCHDVWQAFLLAPDARRLTGDHGGGEKEEIGGWTVAELPLSRFLLTHRGRLVESRVAMNAARVVSVALAPAPTSPTSSSSSSSSSPSSFCLGIESITAVSTTRGLLSREEAEAAEAATAESK